jgi:hypothetical protein
VEIFAQRVGGVTLRQLENLTRQARSAEFDDDARVVTRGTAPTIHGQVSTVLAVVDDRPTNHQEGA